MKVGDSTKSLNYIISLWSNFITTENTSFGPPNGGLVREISLFQGNLGWWNIIFWPDHCYEIPFHREVSLKIDLMHSPPIGNSKEWLRKIPQKGVGRAPSFLMEAKASIWQFWRRESMWQYLLTGMILQVLVFVFQVIYLMYSIPLDENHHSNHHLV